MMHHIVFVDDTPYNLELAQAYLEVTTRNDLRINCFTQADPAIKACQQIPPDLIFLDLEMPGKDGFETINELRRFCHAPVVAMTGHDEAGIKAELLTHTFNDYLGKPFTDTDLFEVVSKHIPDIQKKAKAPHYLSTATEHSDLNIADMSRRLRNNQKLIVRILDSFQSNNTHTFAAFVKSLECQDWVASKRICHTLKGGGANIGADALSAYAAKLEKLCNLRQQPSKADLDHLDTLIENAIEQCRRYINTENNKTPPASDFRSELNTIYKEIDNDLAGAQDKLFELEKQFPEDSTLRECVVAFNEFRTNDVKKILERVLKY